MRKLSTAAIACSMLAGAVTLSPVATAEPGNDSRQHSKRSHHQRHSPQEKINKMLNRIDATDEQRQVIAAIVEANKTERRALKQRHKNLRANVQQLDPMSGDYSNRVAALADDKAELARQSFLLRSNMKQQIALQLTEAQRSQLKTMQAERQARRTAMKGLSKEERRALRQANKPSS